MVSNVLLKEDLNKLCCACCGEDAVNNEMVLHGTCHPEASSWVWYHDGILTVRCARCGKEAARIAVA